MIDLLIFVILIIVFIGYVLVRFKGEPKLTPFGYLLLALVVVFYAIGRVSNADTILGQLTSTRFGQILYYLLLLAFFAVVASFCERKGYRISQRKGRKRITRRSTRTRATTARAG
jgi:hypothetical protein